MTNAPADLVAFRATVMTETGLRDPADVGIVGDGAHARTGGYHEGRDVLASIGRYHVSAAAGSSSEDYSARLARDRAGLTLSASAMDIGAAWPRGGRAAWLRFNRLLVAALQAGDPALAAIRAANYSPDGSARHRIDRQYGFTQIEDTTDSVDIHTHIEWYRDGEGRRQASLDRLAALIRGARDNTSPLTGGTGMDLDTTDPNFGNAKESIYTTLRVVTHALLGGEDPIGNLWWAGHTSSQPNALWQVLRRLDAAAAADTTRDAATLAAVQALSAGGTSVDTHAVLAAIQAVAATESAAVQALHDQLAAAQQQIADLTHRLAAGATAEAAALTNPQP